MTIDSYEKLLDTINNDVEAYKSIIVLIQGLPGSGKSTLASHLSEDLFWNYYEADMYFMVNGEYLYNPKKLGDAHHWCQFAAKDAIENHEGCIVSNTFASDKELQPYYDMAEKNGSKVILIRMCTNFGSVHNVPTEAITRMRNKMKNQLTKEPDYIVNTKLEF